jgi:hypothetical protein
MPRFVHPALNGCLPDTSQRGRGKSGIAALGRVGLLAITKRVGPGRMEATANQARPGECQGDGSLPPVRIRPPICCTDPAGFGSSDVSTASTQPLSRAERARQGMMLSSITRQTDDAASIYRVFAGCRFGFSPDARPPGAGCCGCAGCCGVDAGRSRSAKATRIASTCFCISVRARS